MIKTPNSKRKFDTFKNSNLNIVSNFVLRISNLNRRGFTPIRNKDTKDKCLTGFTLIELLIVMAIIGILATIILTTAYVGKQKARAVVGQNMIRSAMHAIYMCVDGGGTINEPTNQFGGNYICSDTSLNNDRFPNLDGFYWRYFSVNDPGVKLSNLPIYYGGWCEDLANPLNKPCGQKNILWCSIGGSHTFQSEVISGDYCTLR